MSDDASESIPILEPTSENNLHFSPVSLRSKKYKNAITMIVLFLINLLNYMDRFAIAGVLEQIQDYFHIGDAEAGLLQTVFVCSYMALAPLFGYLGDRYSRKLMIILGVTLWSMTTVAGSFVPKHYIVIPTRRSTASSMLIFVMHLLGDASSPYIIGEISDFFRDGADDNLTQWVSLRNALMLTPFIAALGGAAFLFAAMFIVQDRRRAEETIESVDDDSQI
ncbi:unnamed protein product [Rotaria magnacalcarata]|uniref:Major facilitator superfamily (MFS) profile domain-containing protein n=1 Tax=Rotaria magnacalcarata TaxID=392030 RepID=A0A816KJP3_9BILA|nr:unnamed protein product [Rotaria magnacalcarata]